MVLKLIPSSTVRDHSWQAWGSHPGLPLVSQVSYLLCSLPQPFLCGFFFLDELNYPYSSHIE